MALQKDLFEATLVEDKISYAKKQKNIAWLETTDLRLVNSESELRELVKEALATDTPKAVDTETTGLTKDDKLVGVSVSWMKYDTKKPVSFYVPLYSEVGEVKISPFTTLSILKPLIEQPCVWYNYKFDYQVFKNVGIEAGLLADVSLMEFFNPREGIDNTEFNRLKNSGLKQRFKEVFDLDMLSLEDVLGKGMYNFSLAPLELAKSYATVDAYATLQLYYHFLALIDTNNFIYGLETKVLPVVANMEYQGIRIDLDYVKKVKQDIMAENKGYEEKIYELAGEKFNIGSGPMLTHVLYKKLNLPVMKYIEDKEGNPSDKPSTDKDALKLLKDKHPIIEPILKYKENLKLVNTFLERLEEVSSDGNIHTYYRPYGTISGRFISKGPNLQQVPKSDDDESNKATIRKCFVASPGYYFLDFDYSQVEYRLLASFSKDPALIKAFEDDSTDFHQSTASIMFGIPYDKVSSNDRKKGKTLNFGLAYGLSEWSLAQKLGCSEEEAKKLYDLYFEKMPTTKVWIENTHNRIAQQHFASSHLGRIRRLPGAKSADRGKKYAAMREGLNHEIQSTSAEITKIAMVRCNQVIQPKGIRMLLQVHDELLFEVPESIPPLEAVELIKKAMQLPVQGFVKLKVDASIGRNWGDCVDFDEGKGLEQIPAVVMVQAIEESKAEKTYVIEGDLLSKAEELKKIFKKFPGSGVLMLKVGDKVMVPTDVDEETGEIREIQVSASEEFKKEIEALGLVIREGEEVHGHNDTPF